MAVKVIRSLLAVVVLVMSVANIFFAVDNWNLQFDGKTMENQRGNRGTKRSSVEKMLNESSSFEGKRSWNITYQWMNVILGSLGIHTYVCVCACGRNHCNVPNTTLSVMDEEPSLVNSIRNLFRLRKEKNLWSGWESIYRWPSDQITLPLELGLI